MVTCVLFRLPRRSVSHADQCVGGIRTAAVWRSRGEPVDHPGTPAGVSRCRAITDPGTRAGGARADVRAGAGGPGRAAAGRPTSGHDVGWGVRGDGDPGSLVLGVDASAGFAAVVCGFGVGCGGVGDCAGVSAGSAVAGGGCCGEGGVAGGGVGVHVLAGDHSGFVGWSAVGLTAWGCLFGWFALIWGPRQMGLCGSKGEAKEPHPHREFRPICPKSRRTTQTGRWDRPVANRGRWAAGHAARTRESHQTTESPA
ncbi:hypothetical protein SAMN05192558_11172 [Actinokineospora alba]|uniref:Uncharacterized protein n=1 Tax=Actinokineospora alba TaxID=504798 RepID=A0A1H0UCM6_9PSEU|nr:hypothetical protein C8E96_0687 [Actinokineospora alba]SDH56768.1 hypothetical protein SAMN05421871_101509 [Actinokineospora alba]SDP63616.1 hypothetical protein SAMN05192558_11172 [Actinokineospora alba]